jgi:hypothetical protein
MRSVMPFVLAAFTAAGCSDEKIFIEEPRPIWLWTGEEKGAPPCPDGAKPTWDGWANVNPAAECGECSCAPATCKPPSAILARQSTCSAENPPAGALEPDEGSDGGCISKDWFFPFTSMMYEPPRLTPCAPSPTPEPPPFSFDFARACPANPESEQPAAFTRCMTSQGNASCPASFPTRREFVEYLIDYRRCSECKCVQPVEVKCTARITVFSDATCGEAIDSATLSYMDENVCRDMESPDPMLSSIQVEIENPIAGTCEPMERRSVMGGELVRSPLEVLCCER